jgi:hypothetical protein
MSPIQGPARGGLVVRIEIKLELVVGAVNSEMWEPTKPAPPDEDRNKVLYLYDSFLSALHPPKSHQIQYSF